MVSMSRDDRQKAAGHGAGPSAFEVKLLRTIEPLVVEGLAVRKSQPLFP